uniref:Uncharacterized protein n=1 Tax=Noctiluca scintillans TaxID=2966 RepID=A0A7S1FJM7_NOCSC|mmetsp:Transcript_7107/g.19497  ORF Transcript_7107/g.19497 Transcript_7107/m.19497 type:complete len:124 (+) Transcript_7107:154-525(+)
MFASNAPQTISRVCSCSELLWATVIDWGGLHPLPLSLQQTSSSLAMHARMQWSTTSATTTDKATGDNSSTIHETALPTRMGASHIWRGINNRPLQEHIATQFFKKQSQELHDVVHLSSVLCTV